MSHPFHVDFPLDKNRSGHDSALDPCRTTSFASKDQLLRVENHSESFPRHIHFVAKCTAMMPAGQFLQWTTIKGHANRNVLYVSSKYQRLLKLFHHAYAHHSRHCFGVYPRYSICHASASVLKREL